MIVRMERGELNERLYRCLQEIAVLIDDGDRGAMHGAGLTPAHFNVLRLLESGPDVAGHTITRLAELTLCTRGNTSRLVQRLVTAGLVEIRSDSSDQRLARVVLSATGAEHLAAADREHTQLNATRFGEMTDSEIAELAETLSAVSRQLRKHLVNRPR
ncbi:MarR family winged helix-turn-helix transcriptional regulator [Nonomuraea sp. NPDC050153]|uniref:MarR family winged helix-turn-helix transcriptional regulator n=1 Tax=Nonomuraea sp. NPDC050153 TaxID=3364359 RepID=UPI0037880519